MTSKKIFIDSVSPDRTIDSVFVIENPSLRTSKNGKYIACTISDCTGKIQCRIWGRYRADESEIEQAYEKITELEGHPFRIAGKADRYNGETVINVNDGVLYLNSPADESRLDSSDFVYSPADIPGNKKRIYSFCDLIGNEGLKDLVLTVLKKSDGFFEKPAAKSKHHDYEGGLAEHSAEVCGIALSMDGALFGVSLKRDLLIAGAVLHDIGKCESFDKKGFYYAPNPSYSLLGHITPAMQTLSRYTSFTDSDTFRELLHIIQSHHGEHGETRPQTPEAWAVHFADNISATMHEISEDIKTVRKGEISWGKRTDGFVFRSNNDTERPPDKKMTQDKDNRQRTIDDLF